MIAGISILCFAASYSVAMLLEASRPFFRSGVRGAILLGFAVAGFIAHTLYLGYRAANATNTALSSEFDWYLVAAWVLVAVYLYLTWYHPQTAVGLFVLPLVLALIAVARFFSSETPFPESRAALVWGTIHGILILLGTVSVMIGFVSGTMYLMQASRLKHKRPPNRGMRLPNLEWLEQVNSRAIVVSVLTLLAGFLSGVVLNLVNHRLDLDKLPWTDPTVWSFGLLTGWMIAAGLFNALYKPAQRGRKVAYLTVASFAFLVLSLSARLFLPSEHSAPKEEIGQSAVSHDARASVAAYQNRPSPTFLPARPSPPDPCPLPPTPRGRA